MVTWLPLNSCFRTRFGNQPVEGSKTLLKSQRHHLFTNVPLISNRLSCLSCLLVRSAMLGHFFNTLMADHMYSCHNWQKLSQQVQVKLSQNHQYLLKVLLNFRNLYKVFEKKITFIASTYTKLLIPEDLVTWIPLNSCFRTQFPNQPVKGSKTLLKSARKQFYAHVTLISKEIESCIVSVSRSWNPRIVFYHVECRSHVFLS